MRMLVAGSLPALLLFVPGLASAAGTLPDPTPPPPSPPGAQPAEPGLTSREGTFSVPAAIRLAMAQHPALAALGSAWRGARAQVAGADAWDDPQLALTVAPLSLATGGAPPGQGVRLSQRLPWPGAPALRAHMAKERAEIRAAEWQSAKAELALALRLTFADAWEAERALEVNAHHIERSAERKAGAEAALRAGRAELQAPLRAEGRLAELSQAALGLAAQRSVALARLNALLGRPIDAPLPPLARTLEVPMAGGGCEVAPGCVRTEIEAARRAVATQRDAVSLAEIARWPELSLDAQYSSMFMQPEHQWMIGAALRVPLSWEARNAGVAHARALLQQAEQQEAQRRLEVAWEVTAADIAWREVEERIRVLDAQALPTAEAHLAVALAGYETGRVAFGAVLDAENALREVQLAHARALADRYRAAARRLRARGVVLDDESDMEEQVP